MPYGNVKGYYYWHCPHCDTFQKTEITLQTWKIRCRSCRRVYALGTVLYPIPRSDSGKIPGDMLMIDRSGFVLHRRVNRVLCSLCAEKLANDGHQSPERSERSMPSNLAKSKTERIKALLKKVKKEE